MDEGKILIVNISRGRVGEDASRLLGAFLVTKIQLAAMSRVDIPESERRDFYLYVDEFQHFATESFANILSEARKFHLSLIMAHQYIKQMEEPVMDAVFGNVGTLVSFRVGAEDAEFLEKWFTPDFMMNDIVNLGKRQMYLRLMIDGISSRGFSASTLERFPVPEKSYKEQIIEHSRQMYSTKREVVEKNIAEWAGSMREEESERGREGRRERPFRDEEPRRFDDRPPRQFQRRDDSRSFQQGIERDDRPPRQSQQPQAPRQYDAPSESVSASQRNVSIAKPSMNLDKVETTSVPRTISPRQELRGRTGQSVSLNEAFSQGAIDFKGKKKGDEQRPKKEVDTAELRKILEESLKK
jgi:hypothetical protein